MRVVKSSLMERLKIVVWGPGYFGQKWMQEVARSPDAELLGVISRSPGRADTLRQELRLDTLNAFATPDEARQAGADAVIIAVPQMQHRDAALAAIGAGLHVLLEKPLAMNIEEARQVVEATRGSAGRTVMVTQNFRWRPHTLCLRAAVRDGLVGKIGHISLECRQAIKRSTADAWRERMDDPYLGDFAIHHVDLIRYVSGLEVQQAFATSFRPPGSWFDGRAAAAAIFKMTAGVVASYHGTMVGSGFLTPQEGLLTIVGETGTLHLDGRYRVILSGGGEPIVLPEPPVPEGELGYGLRELVDAVRTGRRAETHVEDNFKSFATLMAAVESAASGTVADVQTA
jgi:predicted dehydrogenase